MRGLVWLRRDLRLSDHHALSRATNECSEVFPLFIFDKNILKRLPSNDRRVTYIHESVSCLHKALQKKSRCFFTDYGVPKEVIKSFIIKHQIKRLYFNYDYEPYAKKRDRDIILMCKKLEVEVISLKDQVIFDRDDVIKNDKTSYKVFTPYKRAWILKLHSNEITLNSHHVNLKKVVKGKTKLITLKEIGFISQVNSIEGGTKKALAIFSSFKNRHQSYINSKNQLTGISTSHLSLPLRFGTISIRDLVRFAYLHQGANDPWLSELIWREFFFMILDRFPEVTQKPFQIKMRKIRWSNPKTYFKKWSDGKTGYPIVDAGMRCLIKSGTMPNRVRMIVASFLVKDLLVDWRKGEKIFEKYLLDYDQSANISNWQWCAGVGADAAPYFRIFNPTTQSKKFDPSGEFIRRWCQELKNLPDKEVHDPTFETRTKCRYPKKMVIHELQRERILMLFRRYLA